MGDVVKLKGNSFYGKIIEDLGRHKSTKFTHKEMVVDRALRHPFLDNLEEIGRAYEIKEFKRTVMIKGPYQCGIAVYQLAKLRMLEFCYEFLNKCFNRKDFEFYYMDTDSFYLATSSDSLDDTVRSKMKKTYEGDREN